ncbi:hypothetical protein B0T19DRAFT_263202 [Cercophora scortea]|uniref:Chromo domain-containing protein n=1 Tax=Cercophora scortea TaxID=314031 RepID=A0AAE0IA00_9PEZI|nr:hypothetical protein B0T19DRAFT_263202 [Cercophora scortea]
MAMTKKSLKRGLSSQKADAEDHISKKMKAVVAAADGHRDLIITPAKRTSIGRTGTSSSRRSGRRSSRRDSIAPSETSASAAAPAAAAATAATPTTANTPSVRRPSPRMPEAPMMPVPDMMTPEEDLTKFQVTARHVTKTSASSVARAGEEKAAPQVQKGVDIAIKKDHQPSEEVPPATQTNGVSTDKAAKSNDKAAKGNGKAAKGGAKPAESEQDSADEAAVNLADEPEVEIDTISGHRMVNGEVELRVEWVDRDVTWKAESELWEEAREAVLEYWESQPKSRELVLGLDETAEYFVERILDSDKLKKPKQYRVSWMFYRNPSWVDAKNLPADMIKAWHEEQAKLKKKVGPAKNTVKAALAAPQLGKARRAHQAVKMTSRQASLKSKK